MNNICAYCKNEIKNTSVVMRCCDGTVCSNICSMKRYQDNYDKHYSQWDNTSKFLICPEITIDNSIHRTNSFIPIYVTNREEMNITAESVRNKYSNVIESSKFYNDDIEYSKYYKRSSSLYDIPYNLYDASYNIINKIQQTVSIKNIYYLFTDLCK